MSTARRFRREQARRAARDNQPRCYVCGLRAAGWLEEVPLCIACRDDIVAAALEEELVNDALSSAGLDHGSHCRQLGAELTEELGVSVTVELMDVARAVALLERGGCGHPGCMGVTVDL